jgi:hypothetical protein
MEAKKMSTGNCLGLTIGLLLLVVGIVILVAVPVIGWVIGPLVMLVALCCGGKRSKVWRCCQCRAYVLRG